MRERGKETILEELPHLILCAPGSAVRWASVLSAVVRAGCLLGKRSYSGRRSPVGTEGLVRLPPDWAFFRARDWRSNAFGSPLLLADNYNHTTNDPTIEAQSAQRTHRDFFAERSDTFSGLAIHRLTGSSAGQSQGRALRRLGSGCCLWPPVGRAVRDCGNAIRGGQALPDKRLCSGQEALSGLRAR